MGKGNLFDVFWLGWLAADHMGNLLSKKVFRAQSAGYLFS